MPKTEYANRAIMVGACTDRDGYWPKAHRVRATEHLSHAQVWSRHSVRSKLVNRWDDLYLMKARRGGPNIVRYQSNGLTVTRIAK